ncbi:tetratricopeptide repeat protein [Candidatus Parabeggiatoa sp. HSG14]|uniref:tetratricopeptide repeat protein n=1 Tax=Candidatus Parabeggiatoa sp. HSG14 TaxID=3055593 RepID=UPI0025A76052|nr:tetratricopeptide repeat protein [Thiotrichales bacterium HSG14]
MDTYKNHNFQQIIRWVNKIMFTPYEYVAGLFHLLLTASGIVIILALILGRLIVNFPGLFLSFLSIILEIPFGIIGFLIRLLRMFALQHLLNWIIDMVDKHYFKKMKMGFVQISILLACILFVVISPGEFSAEEVTLVAIFLLLFAYKIITTFVHRHKIKAEETISSDVVHAKRLEKAAFRSYQVGFMSDSLDQYTHALEIYKNPLLIKESSLNINRAKVLEKIGIVLYKDEQLNIALVRFNQALDIYKKKPLADNPFFMKDRIRVLKESVIILRQLGRRDEASKRYEFISELMGKRTFAG